MEYTARAVRQLSRIDVFRSVALEAGPVARGASTVRAEVLVPPRPPPAPFASCDPDDALITVFTLGLYPMGCATDEGVQLRFPGSGSADVVCPWPTTGPGGAWPLVLPGYTRERNREAYEAHLRVCILAHAARFLAAAGR